MKKVIVFLVLISTLLSFTACFFNNADCIINGKEIFFVDNTVKKEWKESLAKLLSNVLVAHFEGPIGDEEIVYKAAVDPDEPTIPELYYCGLLDITRDGTPELLVHPTGYSGSSLRSTYFIYDIYTGNELGYIYGGAGQSWCEYLDLETGDIDLTGRYWTRCGRAGRDRYITMVELDEETNKYLDCVYFRTSYEIAGETTDIVDEDPNDGIYEATWIESYPDTIYYIFDEKTTLDQYYDEYDSFFSSHVRIPETEMILFTWDDVAEDGDGYTVRGEKMAEALISSKQEYIDFNK